MAPTDEPPDSLITRVAVFDFALPTTSPPSFFPTLTSVSAVLAAPPGADRDMVSHGATGMRRPILSSSASSRAPRSGLAPEAVVAAAAAVPPPPPLVVVPVFGEIGPGVVPARATFAMTSTELGVSVRDPLRALTRTWLAQG